MGIESPAVSVPVHESGGVNAASGILDLTSLAMPGFVLPTAG